MGRISLEGMEFYAYHGCFAEEQIIGNLFLVDVKIETDTSGAEESDDISKTINYQEIYLIVKTEMERKSKLLEHVASRIAKSLRIHFPAILKIRVKVSKMNPPLGGKLNNVSVEIRL